MDIIRPSGTSSYGDDSILNLGTGSDIGIVLRSTTLTANTTLAGVLVGTPVVGAIPANSLIISNITADGDIVLAVNDGGNSLEAMRIDATSLQVLFPQNNDATNPTLGFGDGDSGIYESADDTIIIGIGGSDVWQINAAWIRYRSTGGGALSSGGSVPQHSFRGDEDTGVGRPSADALQMSAGGQVGIGLTEVSDHVTQTWETHAGITASVTQAQGNGALLSSVNEVATVGTTNDTVTLPTAVAGQWCMVINNGANTLQVFPAASDNLGAGVDTAETIAAGSRRVYIAYDATNWEPII